MNRWSAHFNLRSSSSKEEIDGKIERNKETEPQIQHLLLLYIVVVQSVHTHTQCYVTDVTNALLHQLMIRHDIVQKHMHRYTHHGVRNEDNEIYEKRTKNLRRKNAPLLMPLESTSTFQLFYHELEMWKQKRQMQMERKKSQNGNSEFFSFRNLICIYIFITRLSCT